MSTDSEAHPQTQHLIGHPLPALIYLPGTNSEPIDIFLLSLETPVIVYCFDGQQAELGLGQLNETIQPIGVKEENVKVVALCGNCSVQSVRSVAKELGLVFDILCDEEGKFSSALELPMRSGSSTPTLSPLLLMIRDAQITRIEQPSSSSHIGQSALRLLRTDKELEAEWKAERAALGSHS